MGDNNGQQPALLAAAPQLSPEDARSLLSSFPTTSSSPSSHPPPSATPTSSPPSARMAIRDQVASLLCTLSILAL
ncbi:hypothetical protein RHMOL_Rhmol04G0011100 [Rhododendron molle]|uniref:Uncharacterized protein n=1 Tax=Rhododendron molle TaxID=49168 RepID=A0ACC0NY63_RHOML|nr:hypothetical protein RHMOL_Rhmol04G0011100 [Rhododendron molle]